MVKRLHKKGFENEAIVFIIAMLIIVVVLIIKLSIIKESGTSSVKENGCYLSVQQNANLHLRGLEFPSSVNCPANHLEIETSDDAARKTIADSMYNCWRNYGQGKLNLFKDEGVYCSVCSFIDVKSKEPITGMQEYLAANTVPDNSGSYYSSYLAGYATANAPKVLGTIRSNTDIASIDGIGLTGGKKYAVLFVYARGYDKMKQVTEHLTLQTPESRVGLATGVFIGGTIGAAAATGIMLVMALSGPPGWAGLLVGAVIESSVVISSAGAVAGGVAGGLSGYLGSLSVAQKFPESVSFIVVREWNGVATQDYLKDFGCEHFPAKLE